jgi:quercetin dioxygenase-like cupin family protein
MSTVNAPGPIIRANDDGDRRWFYGGGLHIWKATAEETGGSFLLFEDQLERGKMTPLHRHPESDESMYVLSGEILMHMDGHEYRVAAGGLAIAPRGLPHAFMVLSEAARLLCLHTPGSCQAFYWGASEPARDGASPATTDFARVGASAEQHGGIELLGPPPFDPASISAAVAQRPGRSMSP